MLSALFTILAGFAFSGEVPPVVSGPQLPGRVLVEVQQSEAGDVVEVSLQQAMKGGRNIGPTVATKKVAKSSVLPLTMAFEDVPPGDYIVLFKGDQETERLAEAVTVWPGLDSQIVTTILPFTVRLSARMDGERLPEAWVNLQHLDVAWTAKVELPDDRDVVAELWQSGRYMAHVSSESVPPFIEVRELPGGAPVDWPLVVADLRLIGTVVDERTKQPIANVPLTLEIESSDYLLSFNATSDEKGKFQLRPVGHGAHTLRGAAARYEPGQLDYLFEAPARERTVTLELRPVSMVPVTILTSRGARVPNARAMFYSGQTRAGRSMTDEKGVVAVPTSDSEIRDVYVIPPAGGFVAFQVKPGEKEKVATLPDPLASIIVNAISDAGQPLQRLAVYVRFNGRLLPVDVVQEIGTRAGSRSFSDASGRLIFNRMPIGLYELWPVESFDQLPVGDAPVKFVAVPGENVANLTFAEQ